jgi:hypothetical protein
MQPESTPDQEAATFRVKRLERATLRSGASAPKKTGSGPALRAGREAGDRQHAQSARARLERQPRGLSEWRGGPSLALG